MNLSELEPHWWWLLAAAILAILEVILPGIFLVWMALAAAITGIATWVFDIPFAWQLALFAVLAFVTVLTGRKVYDDNPIESSDPKLNERAARLVGQTVLVVQAIENGEGRVKVGDGVWNARGPDAEVGSEMLVIGADGASLRVGPKE